MIEFIQISVGSLPDWYKEAEHDFCLEQAISDHWRGNPAYRDATIQVTYNYHTDDAIVIAHDENGDVVFERDNHCLAYAFKYAKEFC